MGNKKSFFEKLTNTITFKNDDDYNIIDELDEVEENDTFEPEDNSYEDSYDEVGELSVDMYRLDDAIVIKAMVAGIQKSEIDITLTRDIVRIEGSRHSHPEGTVQEQYYEELYWGSFERTITLPEEVDIELAEAEEEHGLLTLVLPLVDRERQARLKIK